MDNIFRKIDFKSECCCCFTGHRPEKLRGNVKEIQSALVYEIQCAIQDGYDTFLTGMARGVDLWAANLVLEEKQRIPRIKLFCAVPYVGFEKRWDSDWQKLYRNTMRMADGGKIFYPAFTYAAFEERNHWMVDHSTRIISVFHGVRGGTYHTLTYAAQKGLQIRLIQCEPRPIGEN